MITASCEVSVPALPSEASMTALNDMRPQATVALRAGRVSARRCVKRRRVGRVGRRARATHRSSRLSERCVSAYTVNSTTVAGMTPSTLNTLGSAMMPAPMTGAREAAASQCRAGGGVLRCAHSCCSGSRRQLQQARLRARAARLGAAPRPHRPPPRRRQAAPTVLLHPPSWQAEHAPRSRSPWRPAAPPAAGRPRPAAAAPSPTWRRSVRALRAPTCFRHPVQHVTAPRVRSLSVRTQLRSAAACRMQLPAATAGAMRAFSPR